VALASPRAAADGNAKRIRRKRKKRRRSSLRMDPLERRGRAEVGERRTTIRNRRAVAALLQQLHSLVSCLLLRFSSARRNITLPVHRIRPHRQTLLPVPPPQRIPTIPPLRAAAALASEAEEGEEEEEEAETEEEEEHHHHHRRRRLLRPRIRE
jgi:hypothetical protein